MPSDPLSPAMTNPERRVRTQVLGALAFAGDLSMGQPVDHSPRTALLAARLARAAGCQEPGAHSDSVRLALIRWSGCTANAREFADLFGDDIAGRAALVADRNPFVGRPAPALPLDALIAPLARAHCEASLELARQIELGAEVELALGDLFEWWDGTGFPNARRADAIDLNAQLVTLAGDLEILVRIYGLAKGLAIIESRAAHRYDPSLVRVLLKDGPLWLGELESGDPWQAAASASRLDVVDGSDLALDRGAEILGDYADLKLPQATGGSRRVAALIIAVCEASGIGGRPALALQQAALLHGLGRVSVPNATLERAGPLTEADWELVRLVPHWTARILGRAPSLREAAELASQAFERLDGSGYHRSLRGPQLTPSACLLQCAVSLVAMLSPRPWREPIGVSQASRLLEENAAEGLLDQRSVATVLAAIGHRSRRGRRPVAADDRLTERESAVLALLARGHSNKEIARELGVTPSTAGTHVENIYRKLGVSTRAAAALKASALGILA